MVLAVILFQGLIFIAMIFMLRQFMKGHVSGAVGHLQKLNDELMKQQSDLKVKVEEAEKEYKSKLMLAQQEASALQVKAKKEAAKTIEDAKNQGSQEREKLIQEAIQTRDKMRQEIMAEMEEVAIRHSGELIGEFFSGEKRDLIHDVIVKETMDGLKEVKIGNYKIDSSSAELKVAKPLGSDVKSRLHKFLKDHAKKEIKFKEEVDPSLVAGFILTAGTFVVDGSLTNRLGESAARLKKETARRYQAKT